MSKNKLANNEYIIFSSKVRNTYDNKPGYCLAEMPSTDNLSKTASKLDFVYSNPAYRGRYSDISKAPHKSKAKLSNREIECLEWVSKGKTSYEISKILGLSENTINNYIASTVRKIGATNRLHMVGIALRENYIK